MPKTLARFIELSKAMPLPGLIWAVRGDHSGAATQLDAGARIEPIEGGWYWLHFGLSDQRTHALLETLPVKEASALVRAGEDVQQIQVKDDVTFGTVADLQRGLDGAQDDSSFLHFIVCDRILVTARRNSLHGPGATLTALQRGLKVPSVEALLEHILLQIIEGFDKRIEMTTDEVDTLEDRIIAGIVKDARPRLGSARRTVVRIHRHLSGLRTMLQRLGRNHTTTAGIAALSTHVCQNSEQLEHEILGLRERTRLLQEEVAAMLAEETNKHLRVLSILTILFIPPTFIGGLFGMNLKGMLFADMEHGFLAACVLAAASTALVVWILKRSGILGQRDYR